MQRNSFSIYLRFLFHLVLYSELICQFWKHDDNFHVFFIRFAFPCLSFCNLKEELVTAKIQYSRSYFSPFSFNSTAADVRSCTWENLASTFAPKFFINSLCWVILPPLTNAFLGGKRRMSVDVPTLLSMGRGGDGGDFAYFT